MQITYYGHSCFGVKIGEINLLFDPFITPNPLAKAIDISTIPADYILISHGHGDHVADVAAIAQRTGAKLISNYEIITWFEKQGITNGHGMNYGGKYKFDFGKVRYVNAVHSSSMPDGSYGGSAGGFIITTESEGSFYYSGDTALTYDMRLTGELFDIKFAMLCMGDNYTMGAEDALICSEFIRCDDVIGMHYDTFPPIALDHEKAKKIFARKGKTLHLMEIGATLEMS